MLKSAVKKEKIIRKIRKCTLRGSLLFKGRAFLNDVKTKKKKASLKRKRKTKDQTSKPKSRVGASSTIKKANQKNIKSS
jgi:hypothetical protein